MKTRTAVLLCLGICCLSVLLPLGIFRLQDGMAADKNVSWTSSTEDIAGRYPVVASVYANFYQKLDNPISVSYTHLDVYKRQVWAGGIEGAYPFTKIQCVFTQLSG